MWDMSKFKASDDDYSNADEFAKFIYDEVEKIVGKGEIAGYQCCFLFPQHFQKLS